MSVRAAKVEYAFGQLFTFSGVLEGGIRLIDHYSRWEVLVSLQQHVGLLAHPAAPFVLLLVGLFLIQRSMQRQIEQSLQAASEGQLRDENGNRILPIIKVPKIGTTLIVVGSALIVALAFAVVWLWTYSPGIAAIQQKIYVPAICKTVDCWAQRVKPLTLDKPHPINVTVAPGGVSSVNQSGGITAGQYVIGARTWDMFMTKAIQDQMITILNSSTVHGRIRVAWTLGDSDTMKVGAGIRYAFAKSGWIDDEDKGAAGSICYPLKSDDCQGISIAVRDKNSDLAQIALKALSLLRVHVTLSEDLDKKDPDDMVAVLVNKP